VDKQIRIFPTSYELAEKFAEELVSLINESAERDNQFTVALSGGTTPELLFSVLGDHFSKSVQWKSVQFFWGDERCVPADSSESNFGMTKRKLFDKIVIPSSNIHRIIGENDPELEAIRYSEEISSNTRKRNGLPVFDLVILGLGDDGHTASLFPDRPELFASDKICEVAVHPLTHQRRITITGRVLNNAEAIVFLATGTKKAAVIETILKKGLSAQNLPAYYIVPVNGTLTWYIDKEAGAFL
jgi:6-phosphogluconolactonase